MPVAIAGMHRAGTSLVARLLQLCGLELGPEAWLVPPDADNPAGYWEHAGFVALNERLIAALGGDWDVALRFPAADSPEWAEDELLRRLAVDAASLLEEFDALEPWGWKDPRNSLTLPFWLRLLPELSVVACVRNPLEVAISLQRVGACASSAAGLRVWRLYTELLLEHVPADRRIATHVARYFAEPLPELRRLARSLGLDGRDETLERAAAAVRADLRHNSLTTSDLVDFGASREVIDLYRQLCARRSGRTTEHSGARGRTRLATRILR